jgi:hypothetical protein
MSKSYDDIKKSLTNLYSSYFPTERYIEHFSMDGIMPIPNAETDANFKSDPNIPQEIKLLNIVPTELYSVIQKFDLDPSQLNESDKNLRLKYLDIALKALNDNYQQIYEQLKSQQPKFVLDNMEASKNLSIRLIKLLILEINPIKCPQCPQCPEEKSTKPYLACIGLLFLTVCILLVMYLTKK